MRRFVAFTLFLSLLAAPVLAKKKEVAETEKEDLMTSSTFAGLALRGIGPAITSGRIGDFAVDPHDSRIYYVAVASGGVWKTENAGTTFSPIFDDEGSYSIGTVVVDPGDSNVVWVGTGENNSQRSVSHGDGVYKSLDGGKSWKNMGLGDSEHIARIVVDSRDSNVVYVASQGPLWGPGGDRGVYKTSDGGETWERVLEIDENTGVTDLVFDPRDPDVLYAAAYQRRRRVWTLLNGGPGSAIYKSNDAGAKWRKLENGLPEGDVGRIGLAISSVDPDVVYAIIEATGDESGFYRSTDAGASWNKESDHVAGSPQYYNEIVADPHDVDRVYSLETWTQVSEDGGKTWGYIGGDYRHVDDHAFWIDPESADHLLIGGDGGIYETFDRGATWDFKANLPVTQFYKIAIDDAEPFYSVYGGTQDNATLGGPVRTTSTQGISNADWVVTVMGDGFQSRVEPGNPDIVYSEWQYGGLIRYDRKSGERIDIQPQPEPGEALRWNWDAPLVLSPHSNTRLYFGANRLFRSDDRGGSWRSVSPDLTRQIDRNRLEVMDRVWSVDAVAKNKSTSAYGNLVSLTESPLVEDLLYAGTDDGLIQVTENAGESWREIGNFPGVPANPYVARLEASLHDADKVYASFDLRKDNDFKPYLLESSDRGVTWKSIAGDLPDNGTVWAILEDHVDESLLFAGTEFGVYFTLDHGKHWIELTGGMPTIAVRDMAIQRRENDLVLGTLGRGFYVLDDYSPLRGLDRAQLEKEALLFPVKRTWMFIPSDTFGLRGKAFQGDSWYNASNPPFGAVLTYYLAEGLQTAKEKRQEMEKELVEKDEAVFYPSWDDLRAEDREEEPAIILTIKDDAGQVVRRLTGPVDKGFHRVAWDLRYPPTDPASREPFEADNIFVEAPMGPMVVPGRYSVELAKRVGGELTTLGESQSFETVPLGTALLPAEDKQALMAFQQKTGRLQRAVLGAIEAADEAEHRLALIKSALSNTPGADEALGAKARELEARLADLQVELTGDRTVARRSEPTTPSIAGRVGQIVGGHWTSSSAPTETHRRGYSIAAEQFAPVLEGLRTLIGADLVALEDALEAAGAPWTPGRLPSWSPEE